MNIALRSSAAAIAGIALATSLAVPADAARNKPSRSNSAAAMISTWDRLARCESGGNWRINTGNGYYGGLQFSRGTWLGFGGGKYARTANRATKMQQIEIARKVQRVQGWGAWPACTRKMGLR